MSQNEIERWCRRDYGLHGNHKIRNINLTKMEFTLWVGECCCKIPFSTLLKRQLKLEKLFD